MNELFTICETPINMYKMSVGALSARYSKARQTCLPQKFEVKRHY